ncbi:hypothetical protein METP3_02854 [Methanosarcinales archaeon]|nr:hypothetical protein METP3_02854 [Methanosarcinales archaeon]
MKKYWYWNWKKSKVLEALFGAIYLNRGFEETKRPQ